MAFTEKYVRSDAAGGGDGTTNTNSGANGAWTFAEMITAAPAAGTRVNVRVGAYSVGAYTLGTGTVAAHFVIRGFNASIGDLDNLGRNADGTLNTTNMPDITITAAWTPGAFAVLQNLDITSAVTTAIITSSTVDNFIMISCNVVNTANNSGARGVTADDRTKLINCDFTCSGAAHGQVVAVSIGSLAHTCRFKGTDTDVLYTINDDAIVIGCLFWGNASSVAIDVTGGGTVGTVIVGNTFYGIGDAVRLPNAVNTALFTFINNHCTDCSKWINSQYSGTANVVAVEGNNRTRDVTTLLTGVESVALGAVTTDTGDHTTDYTDATTGNFRLISTAPGKATGLTPYVDIGAYQRAEAGAGGLIRHPAMTGGCNA